MNQHARALMMFAGVIMLFLLVNMISTPQQESKNLKFTEIVEAAKLPADNPDRVVEVTFREKEIVGTRADKSTFKSYGPADADVRKALTDLGVAVNFEAPEEPAWWQTLLINSLPMLFLLFLFFFFMRQLQVGGGKAMSFGKSRAKMVSDRHPKVTFADVAGIDEALFEVQEIIDFLKDPKKFTRLGARIPKGVLLVGPPGTGKTILARAIAGEAGVPFFSISGSDFVEMFVGVGASRVRDLFDQAKKSAPCIIFIDEIDAVGRHRGAGLGGGHDEREQTLNQLLVEMDGFEGNEGVILVAATNRPDVLDPALLRPGRFDRRIVVPKPDVKGREGILKVHTRKVPLAADVKVATLAQGTPGFAGADLENLVNEAALIAAREDRKEVSMRQFELAKDKVIMGPERRSMIINEKEKRNTAFHEAGHALVARLLPDADPVHKVSIIPRGQALGVTMLLPAEDKLTVTKEFAKAMIAYAMGGRAAEEIVFGRQTTGAGDDIEKATDIARKMVCQWGMSEKLGPLAFGKRSDEVFIGRDMVQQRNYSERVAEEIDGEIRALVQGGYDIAVKLIREHRAILDLMSEALLIRENLDGPDLDRIMKSEDILTAEERQAYAEGRRLNREPNGNAVATIAPSSESASAPTLEPAPQGT
jgi:cell division protease FtsH